MTATTKQVCPSCGQDRVLIERTGFCRPCTNEHERGSGGPNPGYK